MLESEARIHYINRYLCKMHMTGLMLAMIAGLSSSSIYGYQKGKKISKYAALRLHRSTGGQLDYHEICDETLKLEEEDFLAVKAPMSCKRKRRRSLPRMNHV